MKKILLITLLLLSFSSFARFQLKVAPVQFTLGVRNIDFGYLHDKFLLSVGVWEGSFVGIFNETKVSEQHLRLDYFLSGLKESSWYLVGAISKIDLEFIEEGFLTEDLTGEESGTGYYFGGGYRWQWKSFFMEFGAQYIDYDIDTNIEVSSKDGSEVETANLDYFKGIRAEYNLGWLF